MTEQHEQAHAPVSPKVYVAVYISLLAGLGITILAAYHDLGKLPILGWGVNALVVLAVAFTQAALVALYSMHLKNSSKLNKLSVGSCFFTLAILFGLVLMECSSRAWGSW